MNAYEIHFRSYFGPAMGRQALPQQKIVASQQRVTMPAIFEPATLPRRLSQPRARRKTSPVAVRLDPEKNPSGIPWRGGDFGRLRAGRLLLPPLCRIPQGWHE